MFERVSDDRKRLHPGVVRNIGSVRRGRLSLQFVLFRPRLLVQV